MPFWHIATHGHALQLAVGETIKAIKIIRGTLDAAMNWINLSNILWFKNHRQKFKYSLKRKELPIG